MSVQLTTLQHNILIGLLSTNGPVAAAELAHALSVSTATVRRNLRAVERWLNDHKCSLERWRGVGLFIDTDPSTRRALLERLARENCRAYALSAQERLDLLLFTIHTSPMPLITQQLQNLLRVSRSTVLKDLSVAAEWYEERNLFLVRRPNYGVKLMGKEEDWRKVFIELVRTHLDEPTLLRICNRSQARTISSGITNLPLARILTEYLARLPLARARELVRVAEWHLRVRFADADHLTLTLHIALLIHRVQEKNVVNLDAARLGAIENQPAYAAACQIAALVGETYGLVVPRGEIAHLTTQLLGAKLDSRVPRDVPAEPLRLAEAVIARASQILRFNLAEDRELLMRLAVHLGPALRRLSLGLSTRNPLLQDIQRCYQRVYEAAEIASQVLSEYTGKEIPPDEVGYIAMYLAGALMRSHELKLPQVLIVCPSGMATSWLLHSRLRNEFRDIKIVDILSARDLQRGVPYGTDLIVTTVPLPDVRVPTVVVSALLSTEDIEKVRRAVDELLTSPLCSRSSAQPSE